MSEPPTAYDGFISYSHAADDQLAPRLQEALQRFAKPWWQRRSIRLFRDEASLAANPHLWSSITDALDKSSWFVLLLSPDAANSEWVNREIDYWTEHRDPRRILPVVTGGDFAWTANDVAGNAVPDSLCGVFAEEPRWVDLRFARTEDDLDLQHPQFANAVADLAAAIRGVPKDELASEEVRQHRRTIRTAWAAGLLLTALTVTSVAVSIQSNRNATEAERQTGIAQEQTQAAEQNLELAEEQTREADRLRELAVAAQTDAQRSASLAEGREWILQAEKQLPFDPELSLLLGLAASDAFLTAGEPVPSDAVSVLRAGIASDRVVSRIPGGLFAAASADGRFVVTSHGNQAAVWDLESMQMIETYSHGDFAAHGAAFSPDGRSLAVAFRDAVPSVIVFDRQSGDQISLGDAPFGESVRLLVFSPNGALLAFDSRLATGVEVWSVADEARVFLANETSSGPDFGPDGFLIYGYSSDDDQGIRLVDTATWERVDSVPLDFPDQILFTAWSPDGTRIATGTQVSSATVDVATGAEMARADLDRSFRPVWLDNERFVVGGESIPRVIDAVSGEVVAQLLGQSGGTWSYDVIPGTSTIVSASLFGTGTALFDTSPIGGTEIAGWVASPPAFDVWYGDEGQSLVLSDGNAMVSIDAQSGVALGPAIGNEAAWFPSISGGGRYLFVGTDRDTWIVHDRAAGSTLYETDSGWSIRGLSDDATLAVVHAAPSADGCGPSAIIDVATRATVADLAMNCVGSAFFSGDGTLVAVSELSTTGGMRIFDTATGVIVATLEGTPYDSLPVVFTSDNRKLIAGNFAGTIHILDLPALLEGTPPEATVLQTIEAHDALILRMELSPDGNVLASVSWNEPLKLWDLATGDPIGDFGGELTGRNRHAGAFHPMLDHLAIASPGGEIRIHTMDIDELLEIARAAVSRELTEDECQIYLRRSCSTAG